MRKSTFFLLLAILTVVLGVSFFLNKVAMRQSYDTKKNIFVTEKEFKKNLANQLQWTPQTISKLREEHIQATDSLKISYYFYTNDSLKAEALTNELKKLSYYSELERDFSNRSHFSIIGKTVPIKMSTEILLPWTKKMCELGYKFDCDFDGWEIEVDSSYNNLD